MKAAEAELNRRAAAGWRLERLWLGTVASFVPAEEPVCYCLDWLDPLKADQPGYASLLAEAGWTRRALAGYQVIYEAPAGTTPSRPTANWSTSGSGRRCCGGCCSAGVS